MESEEGIRQKSTLTKAAPSNAHARALALAASPPAASAAAAKTKKPAVAASDDNDLLVEPVTIDANEVVSMVTLSLQSAILTKDRCTAPLGLDNAAENLVRLLSARRQSKADASRKNRRVTISEEAIKSVFNLPISRAAAELGVGLTVLKKYCRIFNITRWPFRKLKSLDKLVSTVSSIQDEHSVSARSAVAQGLEHKKLEMRLMPSIELDREIKRIRQAAYKLEHKKRRAV